MHRQFSKIVSQTPENVQTQCNDRNNSILFAVLNWMIKQEIDINEN